MARTLPHMDAQMIAMAAFGTMSNACFSLRQRHHSALLSCALILVAAFAATDVYAAFDHSHAKLDNLLGQHVAWTNDGHASQVDYAAIKRDPSLLKDYLAEIASVSNEDYRNFTKSQQLAFLINAYNAYTIDFVLTKYPDIASVKQLGSLFNSPWKKRLFPLLGEKRSLDEIEHSMIRKPGDFDDPRIHMAVNCASVSCPALRDEAFVAGRLDTQLEDSVRRFLGDSSRNRADERGLWVSKIFDWYAVDFEKHSGSVAGWLAPYAEQLSNDPELRAALASGSLRVRFLGYDWALNDRQTPG